MVSQGDESQTVASVSAKEMSADLHKLIGAVHRLCPSAFGRAMWEHSEKVQAATTDAGLGVLNRLRYLIHAMQTKTGCEQFYSPCDLCGKVEKQHPWQKVTCYKPGCTGALDFVVSRGSCSLCSSELTGIAAVCTLCGTKVGFFPFDKTYVA